MPFHAALSTASDLETACREIAASVRGALGDAPLDLLLVFAGPAYGDLHALPGFLLDVLPAQHLIGTSGDGILASGREIEDGPALAVLAARFDGVGIHPHHLEPGDLPDPDAPPRAWAERLGLDAEAARGFVLLPDPYSFPITRLLDGLDYAFPGATVVGGLASGGQGPGRNFLFLGRTAFRSGTVVVGLSGAIRVDAVVAQGCKPIGAAGTITRCDGHELPQIDGRPALRFLEEQMRGLDEADLELARRAPLFVGLAMDPFAVETPEPGEFLIRQILGIDREHGSLAIAGAPRSGRRVRFHLRDRHTSADDLERSLDQRQGAGRPDAALLFSCMGRGEHLYGEPDHDSSTFLRAVGRSPLAVFFCNGEIGPVGGSTHLHGYTSVFALLREGADA
jgi:small ligand-binding sensory domain FIST